MWLNSVARSRSCISIRNLPFTSSTLFFSWLASFLDNLPQVAAHMSTSSSRLTFYKLPNLFHVISKSRVLIVMGQLGWCAHPWPNHCSSVDCIHWLVRPGSHVHFSGQVSMRGQMGDLPNKNQDDDTRRRRLMCQSGKYISVSYKCLIENILCFCE